MMIMCRRATELMSQRLDRSLTWRERLSLRFHLSMCGACSECNRQFELLHHAGNRYIPAGTDASATQANPDPDDTTP